MGQLGLKVAFILVCLVIIFGGHHPPSYAQNRQQLQYVPVVTAEDAVQDADIVALNKHLESTDTLVRDQWKAIAANASDIAGMRGEERIIGALLGVIASSSFVLQLRKKAA